ncbi:MAG: shikimate dehydrogenase [Phycisphaerales bacterium]|nr:shikimate dehydrogenase [Phycisphaerales bacterium]
MFPDRRQSQDIKKEGASLGAASFRTGLIGAAIQQSGSPAIHAAEAEAAGLDYSYELFDLDMIEGGASALERVLAQIEGGGFAGVNITHPCKQAVIPLLHELSPDAKALGAVNTIVFERGRRHGHNTDCVGFAEGLARGLPGASIDCVAVLGAGGGGAAVTYALLRLGARDIIIHDVAEGRAEALVARLAAQFPRSRLSVGSDLRQTADRCNGIVNCTPIGMDKYPGMPIASDLIAITHWIADIVYFPLETEFLCEARKRGCATLDGGGMAVFQAAEAFRLFTGRTPDHARMLARFREQSSAKR